MEKRFPRLIQNGKIIPVNCWKSHMHTLIPEKPLRQLYRYTPKWQDRIYQDGILKNSQVTHQFSSVQFSCSVLSDSLRPHESQHTRPPCPLPTPRVYSNSYPSSWWCHPTISSSVIPFSSCSQPLPESGSFPVSQLFAWGGQSIGVSASRISLSLEHPGLISFRMDWLDLLAVQGALKSLLQHHSSKVSIFQCSAFFTVQLSHPYMTTGNTIALSNP